MTIDQQIAAGIDLGSNTFRLLVAISSAGNLKILDKKLATVGPGRGLEENQLLHEHAMEAGIALWAYCLMDNHVHLIAVPKYKNSLAKGIGQAHRNYTWLINSREGWRGYLWQGRFSSYPMDERYLYTAVRYTERNPVRAGLVKKAQDYPFINLIKMIINYKNIVVPLVKFYL